MYRMLFFFLSKQEVTVVSLVRIGGKCLKYVHFTLVALTLSAQQTKTDTCAKRVDLDEMAHNEPSHQALHCLQCVFDFRLKPLFASVNMSTFKDGEESTSDIQG